jgi:hypothetical protein
MCIGKPKVPKVEPIPDRRASVLPDSGDPSIRAMARGRRRMMPSAMIFSNQSTLGSPIVSGPIASTTGG